MKGCKRNYIQTYLDEFMWRFNNQVHNNRTKCYSLILSNIQNFYYPGTTQDEFEKLYTISTCAEDEDVVLHYDENDDQEESSDEDDEEDVDTESLFGSLKDSGSEKDPIESIGVLWLRVYFLLFSLS